MIDMEPVIVALRNKLQVILTYVKKNGETVVHTGGMYEIGVNKAGNEVIWLWDTALNDHIRQFLVVNVTAIQVLDISFFPPQPYPIKLDGEVVA